MIKSQFEYVVITSGEARNRARFLVEPLRSCGHRVRTQKLSLSASTLSEIRCWFTRGDKPDAIIFVGIGLNSSLLVCLAYVSRLPVIIRLGGHPLEDKRNFLSNPSRISRGTQLKYLLNYAVAKVILKLPFYVICVNEDLARRIKPNLRQNAEIFVVPQFCDGQAKKNVGDVKGPAQCLTVANLNFMSKARGVIWLIEQLNDFCEKTGNSVTFCVAGDGICKSVIREFLASFEGNSKFCVRLLGFIQGVDALYASADVFLYHSEHDGTPNVLLEAKRWGIPTLVNNYSAFQSIISHGETGLIFRNEDEFQALLARSIDDVSLRRKISSGALIDHESRFSKEAVAMRLEHFIQKVCRQHARR